MSVGSQLPRPQPQPSLQVLTRSGDIGQVAGIADIATSQGHEAKLVENILGVEVSRKEVRAQPDHPPQPHLERHSS